MNKVRSTKGYEQIVLPYNILLMETEFKIFEFYIKDNIIVSNRNSESSIIYILSQSWQSERGREVGKFT